MLADLSREQQLIILGLVLLLVTGLSVMVYRHIAGDRAEEIVIEPPMEKVVSRDEHAKRVVVHIAGAVKREGVYKLRPGDRVVDALNLAGGATPGANLASINLAEKVKDGQKILIPLKPAVPKRQTGGAAIRTSAVSSGKVNINAASEKELCKVPGIGPSTAKKIIEYRSSNGLFSKIEDVMKVKGIGKGKFERIKNNICL
jgi:competence protein ComEA